MLPGNRDVICLLNTLLLFSPIVTVSLLTFGFQSFSVFVPLCSIHFCPNYPFVIAFRDLVALYQLLAQSCCIVMQDMESESLVFVYFTLHVIVLRLYSAFGLFTFLSHFYSFLSSIIALFTCNFISERYAISYLVLSLFLIFSL